MWFRETWAARPSGCISLSLNGEVGMELDRLSLMHSLKYTSTYVIYRKSELPDDVPVAENLLKWSNHYHAYLINGIDFVITILLFSFHAWWQDGQWWSGLLQHESKVGILTTF